MSNTPDGYVQSAHDPDVDKFDLADGTGRDAAEQSEVEKRFPHHVGPVAEGLLKMWDDHPTKGMEAMATFNTVNRDLFGPDTPLVVLPAEPGITDRP